LKKGIKKVSFKNTLLLYHKAMSAYFRDYIDVREEDEVQNGPRIAENRYFKLIEAFFEEQGLTPPRPLGL
jgi:hypothetical protein